MRSLRPALCLIVAIIILSGIPAGQPAYAVSAPSVPTNLAVVPITSTSVRISWDQDGPCDGFVIFREDATVTSYFWGPASQLESCFGATRSTSGTVTHWELVDDGTKTQPYSAGSSYELYICSYTLDPTAPEDPVILEHAWLSSTTAKVSVIMPHPVPTAPSDLTATAGPGNSVVLNWQDNSNNENEFLIERRTGAEPFTQIGTSPMDWGRYTDNTVTPGTTYDFRVAAYNVYGPSAYAEVSYTVPSDGGGGGGTPPGGGPSGTPPDVSTASSWAQGEILQAWNYGLTTDRVLSNYQDPVTREEFCEIAVLLYEKLTGMVAQPTSPNPFTDTSNPSILKAYNLGITQGVSATQFAPANQITREQICTMITRACCAADPSLYPTAMGVTPPADYASVSGWAREGVLFCYGMQIMKGVGGGNIDPLGTTTKEQAILLIKRTYEKMLPTMGP